MLSAIRNRLSSGGKPTMPRANLDFISTVLSRGISILSGEYALREQREHRGSFFKQLLRFAAPTAACVLMSPLGNAQETQFSPGPDEGRVSLVELAAANETQPTYANPQRSTSNSLQAIFAPNVGNGVVSAFSNRVKPASLDTPNMIGDFLGYTGSVSFNTVTAGSLETTSGTFALPASGRVPKIAENNSAIPRDRIYFAYNHFHNAYDSSSTVNPNDVDVDMNPIPSSTLEEQFDQNRFTLGIEKTLFYGDLSVEARMPLVTQIDHTVPSVTDPNATAFRFGTNDPTGNLTFILKQVLIDWYGPESSGVFTGGFGLTIPTSEGANVQLGDASFNVDDMGVHFSPYLALLIDGQKGWFLQAFAEFDTSTDKVIVHDRTMGRIGKMDIPDVINLDVGIGWWLHRYPNRRWLKGIAPIVEFHHSAQQQDLGTLAFQSNGALSSSNVVVGAFNGKRDTSNLTAGVHVILNDHMNARVGGVVPLKDAPDREFDAEFVFQLDVVR